MSNAGQGGRAHRETRVEHLTTMASLDASWNDYTPPSVLDIGDLDTNAHNEPKGNTIPRPAPVPRGELPAVAWRAHCPSAPRAPFTLLPAGAPSAMDVDATSTTRGLADKPDDKCAQGAHHDAAANSAMEIDESAGPDETAAAAGGGLTMLAEPNTSSADTANLTSTRRQTTARSGNTTAVIHQELALTPNGKHIAWYDADETCPWGTPNCQPGGAKACATCKKRGNKATQNARRAHRKEVGGTKASNLVARAEALGLDSEVSRCFGARVKLQRKIDAKAERFLSAAHYHFDADPDSPEACSLYVQAAACGSMKAHLLLAEAHKFGEMGLEVDETKVIEWYAKAASGGNTEALCKLARINACPNNPTPDVGSALELYRRAAGGGGACAKDRTVGKSKKRYCKICSRDSSGLRRFRRRTCGFCRSGLRSGRLGRIDMRDWHSVVRRL